MSISDRSKPCPGRQRTLNQKAKMIYAIVLGSGKSLTQIRGESSGWLSIIFRFRFNRYLCFGHVQATRPKAFGCLKPFGGYFRQTREMVFTIADHEIGGFRLAWRPNQLDSTESTLPAVLSLKLSRIKTEKLGCRRGGRNTKENMRAQEPLSRSVSKRREQ